MPYDRSGTSMEETAMYFPQKMQRRGLGYVDSMNMAGLGDVIDPLEQLAIQGYTVDDAGNVVPLGSPTDASGGGSGDTDTSATAPTGTQLQTVLSTINALIAAGSTAQATASLATLNMQRARQGLPPITLQQAGAYNAASSSLLLWLILGVVAVKAMQKK